MRRVLLVASEAAVADGLRRSLRVFSNSWALEVVGTLTEAGLVMSERPVDAVVCDVTAADIGIEAWLDALRREFPRIVRAALCGPEMAKDVAQRMVNVANQVIRKPVVATQLFELVERACVVQGALQSPHLSVVLGQLGSLPAMPQTYAKVAQLATKSDVSMDEVATVVERDPAVSANVLRIINSAYFGLPRRVASVRETVRYLGIQPLKNIVLTVEVFEGMAKGPEARDLQQLALQRACAMRELLGRTPMAETAFAAGILCDLGELLLVCRMPDEARWVRDAMATGLDRSAAERKVLGCEHADVGGAVLSLWNMPNALVEAVVMHHRPPEGGAPPNVATALALVCAVEDLSHAQGPARARLEAVVDQLMPHFPNSTLASVERQVAPTAAAA